MIIKKLTITLIMSLAFISSMTINGAETSPVPVDATLTAASAPFSPVKANDYKIISQADLTDDVHVPIVAKQQNDLAIYVKCGDSVINLNDSGLGIEVRGRNLTIEPESGSNPTESIFEFENTGSYYVVVYNKDNPDEILAVRKIYVNSFDGRYYQLGKISIKDSVANVQLFQDCAGTIPNMNINVTESYVKFDSKTLRADYNPDSKQFEGALSKINFGIGNYSMTSSLMSATSLEALDQVRQSYSTGVCAITAVDLTEFNGMLSAHAVTEHNEPEAERQKIVYAFLIKDDMGIRVLQDYSTDNNIIIPEANWNYDIIVRAKHLRTINDQTYIQNSYECTQVYHYRFHNPGVESSLAINDIDISNTSIDKFFNDRNPFIVHMINKPSTVVVKNNNFISVDVSSRTLNDGEYLSYKAVVDDSGNAIFLDQFEANEDISPDYKDASAWFTYYPRSGGSLDEAFDSNETHTLTVYAALHNKNGTIIDQTSKEFTLDVIDEDNL